MLRHLHNTMLSKFSRGGISSCSEWTSKYRVMGPPFPGPCNFTHHPWTKGMHDCTNETIIGQKAAQMGYSETALHRALYQMDMHNQSVMYVLPAQEPDANNFSAARFDPALEMSPYLSQMFSEVRNVGHKRAGNANLFLRGSKSRNHMKSLPVANIILDEFDEMNQANVSLALERTSGQPNKSAFYLSTPTRNNMGINSLFITSSQNHFWFPCPSCSRHIELRWPDSFNILGESLIDPRIRESHLKCYECHAPLSHEDKISYLNKGEWQETFSDRRSTGFYINQMYSMTVSPLQLVESYFKGLTSPSEEEEFYNSKLGLPHTPDGTSVSDDNIKDCMITLKKTLPGPGSIITMGVDVGKALHIEVAQWNFNQVPTRDVNILASPRIIYEGKVQSFEELDNVLHQYRVNYCVVDAQPETRAAIEFAQRNHGLVRLCYYANGVAGKMINIHEDSYKISVDRTTWLDMALGRFFRKSIALPSDTSDEYKKHMMALTRIREEDKHGNPIGRYTNDGNADHFAHARCYCEIALPLAVSLATSQDIASVL